MIESSIPPSKERSPPISCYANGVFDSDQTGLRFRSIAVGIVGNLEMTLGWPRCAPAERHLPILVTVASNLQLLVLAVGVALLQCMSLLLAHSGHGTHADECLLLGVKRTLVLVLRMVVPDPKQ